MWRLTLALAIEAVVIAGIVACYWKLDQIYQVLS